MLHIILLILKILGIILLIAVGFLSAVLCAILFVAVSWQILAEREGTFRVNAKVSWLFRAVTVRFLLDENARWKPVFQIRLFGCLLRGIPGGKRANGDSRGRRMRWRRRKARREERITEDRTEEKARPKRDDGSADAASEARKSSGSGRAEPSSVPRLDRRGGEERASSGKKSFFKRIFQKIACTVRSICDRIKSVWEKAVGLVGTVRRLWERKEALLAFWNLEEHRSARGALWKEARYLWRKSRPKKIRGRVVFGCADPSHTGLCMGAVGMLCAWYPKDLKFIPDFEQKILKGEILLKGRIRCYILLRIFLRIYFNKEIRHMYQHWQEL